MKQISIEDLLYQEINFIKIPYWIRLKKGEYWCPYCHRAIKFSRDKNLGVRKCECGISDRDFNIRNINKLWT